jgi:hypothetical protein
MHILWMLGVMLETWIFLRDNHPILYLVCENMLAHKCCGKGDRSAHWSFDNEYPWIVPKGPSIIFSVNNPHPSNSDNLALKVSLILKNTLHPEIF